MHQYGVRDVEKLLGLPRTTLRALITAGFVTPARGPRNAWLFSFQDLIVLRTAQALAEANLPHRRIIKSLRELRRHLPDKMPISGLRIGAVADRVVVSEGGRHWQAESGQYLLGFEGDPAAGSLAVLQQPKADDETDNWFGRALRLETSDVIAAIDAYERAIAADPAHMDARINLGRVLHEAGRHAEAERVYREALAHHSNATLLFNLGALLDDLNRRPEAIASYEAALRLDPGFADSHYNLALLYEDLGKPRDALRHMARYRRLVGNESG
jgi:tetratricopeptide (TPR) repeat protein